MDDGPTLTRQVKVTSVIATTTALGPEDNNME